MTSEKDLEGVGGTEDEKKALKVDDGEGMEDEQTPNDFDSSRARFISGSKEKVDANHAEVYVDVEGKTKLDDSFVGLSKEELMKFADDPYWKKVRLALLILFWVGWCGMLAAAIIIIVVAPKCPPRPNLDWWQTGAVQQMYPQSFKDSNGDGVGDLKGIHEKLNYLQGHPESLNVSTLWLSAIYPHGETSQGYDVTDFKGISEEFGTMEDFEALKVALHKKNMKLIMEFIPNHSSDKHPWFESSRNKKDKYADYYVWHAGHDSGTRPPNDWQSVSGGSAWTLDSVRGEYFLHQFSENQPDLNLRSEDVQEELLDVLKFWLAKGVDGFNVQGASRLFECANFTGAGVDQSCTEFQPESYEMVTKWREALDAYSKEHDTVQFLMVQVKGNHNQTGQFYEYEGKDGAHMSGNSELMSIESGCEASCVYDKINAWMSFAEPRDIWSNWQTGCPNTERVVSRFGNERDMINAMNLLLMTLPGTSISYYGEEIGMRDLDVADLPAGTPENSIHRTPMQWSGAPFAGFTEGNATWLPIPSDYNHVNVKSQMAHGSGITNLEVYQSFIEMRKEPSMQWGKMEMGVTGNILFYVRQAEGFPGFLVAINFGPSSSTVDFVSSAPKDGSVPDKAKVFAHTANFANAGSDYDLGTEADMSNLILAPAEGVVFKWEADAVK